jgi:hypothetical protein
MSLRGEELNAYLDLVAECSKLSGECSALYDATLAEVGSKEWRPRDRFDERMRDLLKASSRRDALLAKMLREDRKATVAELFGKRGRL